MIKQQRILIIVFVVAFAALLAAYFIVIRPLTTADETTAAPLTPDQGEEVENGDRLLMFPRTDRDNIQSIEVHNEYGTYTFSYNAAVGDFQILGYETLSYDQNKFAKLVVSAGYPLTIERISEKATDEQLVEYGFKGEDASPSHFTLTTRTGEKHTVLIGRKLLTGAAYYAMYDGRDTIYAVTSEIEDTLLAPVEGMIMPMLTAGVPLSSYYMIDNFSIKHYGEDYLICRNKTKEELSSTSSGAFAEAITVMPEGYVLSMYYDQTLESLATYQGESVAAVGLTDEHLEEFGLKDKPYEISYEYDGFKFELVASEPKDGYYYVATSMFGIIVKVPEEDFAFLKWDYLRWIDPLFISFNIQNIDTLSIESESVNEVFELRHRPNDTPNLTVVGKNSGEVRDIDNFRQFYLTLLYSRLEDYAPEDVKPDESMCILKLRIKLLGGAETEYGFYRYSGGRCLLTINGEGEFYVYDDNVQKIIGDADKVMKGLPVDATGRS